MVTDILNITARGERTFGPSKVNVKQSNRSCRDIYHLSVTVLPIPVYLKKDDFRLYVLRSEKYPWGSSQFKLSHKYGSRFQRLRIYYSLNII